GGRAWSGQAQGRHMRIALRFASMCAASLQGMRIFLVRGWKMLWRSRGLLDASLANSFRWRDRRSNHGGTTAEGERRLRGMTWCPVVRAGSAHPATTPQDGRGEQGEPSG